MGYDSIEIPDSLEFIVRDAMKKAQSDKPLTKQHAEQMRVRKSQTWIKSTLATAAAVMVAFVGLANSTPAMSDALEQLPVLGPITKVVSFRDFKDTTRDMTATVHVPAVDGSASHVNAEIKKYTDTVITQYKKDVKATGGKGPMAVDLSYQTVTDNDTIFALRFDKTTSMADTNQEVKIYNVDKRSGAIMTLGNLFKPSADYRTVLSENIKKQMREQMKADKDKTFFIDSKDMPEFDFNKIPKNMSFYVNAAGQLVLVFNKGDVAPMYMGIVEFTIPASITTPLSNGVYLK